jgi:hypothetical protein
VVIEIFRRRSPSKNTHFIRVEMTNKIIISCNLKVCYLDVQRMSFTLEYILNHLLDFFLFVKGKLH